MTDRAVPAAYVTKWSKSSGIIVWRDASADEDGYLFEKGEGLFASVGPKHWTTDRATAEARWRQAVETEAKRLKAAAKKYEALSKGAPVYAKEEG